MEITWNNNPIKSIIAIMNRLTGILEQENRFLENFRVSDIQNLQEEKMALANSLEVAQRRIAMNPSILGSVPEREKRMFEAASAHFTTAMTANYNSLLKAKAVNGKIIELIALAASQHFKSAGGYNKKGSHNGISIGATKREGALPPVSFVSNA